MEGRYIVPALKKKNKSRDVERESWDELRRRINGLVNKIMYQISNRISSILRCHRGFNRRPVVRFLAHLVNLRVANETIALELLLKLLVEPTGDTVEVAVVFVTECGALLQEVSPRGFNLIFDSFRRILHEGDLEYRSRCLIESLVTLRRLNFKDHPAIRPQLDLVDLDEQVTHKISLLDDMDPETSLDVFKPDPEFQQNEGKYELMKKKILGEEDTDLEEEDDDDADDERVIKDDTETDLVNLRRTIYQTIMSSLDFEEAGYKLLKIRLEPGQEMELCVMVLECCSEEKTYRSFYGHLAHRFCLRSKVYRECFENLFVQQYSMVHRFDTNKLISVATFFGHLLATDALPWHVLAYVRLTEEDTTSSSRIFLKNLFLQLAELLGIKLLNEKLHDPTMEETVESIFPKDHLKNTLFSINFFTKIGLGGITQKLRQFIAKRKETDSEESSDDETERKRRRKRG
ncbi:Initiation factor eIF-4 gamma MA3 [Arabidopsis thaliana x Arabidopsis arenosa]|uniref:Initiation factor eIF-4 gamma MA3 n=1 Tax=Arabidopsis thaliana x Arabidopsis arenosa TaxID=1240361 RepID=A0A8T2C9J3_9BRAS|nr:Initiation factor eIF-4 gamma MA3 [Arabidopsis thaliana x Arabidopsis arenosa]